MNIIIPLAQRIFLGGILVSVRSSVPHLSRVTCPLCSAYSFGWIHFISIHLTKQLQKVCCMYSFLQTYKIIILGNFFLICNFDFVFFWLGIWCETLVWVIIGLAPNKSEAIMWTSVDPNCWCIYASSGFNDFNTFLHFINIVSTDAEALIWMTKFSFEHKSCLMLFHYYCLCHKTNLHS